MKLLRFTIMGILFGIVLSKAEIISWYRIQEMFRFQSFHMYGVIGSAVFFGLITIQFIKRMKLKDSQGEMITVATQEAELASWLFLKHLTSPEVQADWLKSTKFLPVRKSSKDYLSDFFLEYPKYSTVFELLNNGDFEPALPGYDFVRELMAESMAAVFKGEDAVSLLSELTIEANTILKDQFALPISTIESIPIQQREDE